MNVKRREDMVDVFSKRRILMRLWGVVGKPGHNDVHHHIRLQHSVNDTRYGPGPSHQGASPPRDRQRRLLP